MKYVFARDVTPEDWSALPRSFKAGETIHRFSGHDYGCARDDMQHLGVSTISCSVDGGVPFFTVPADMLRTEEGHEVCGDYIRFPAA
jgi:hypothetical protein